MYKFSLLIGSFLFIVYLGFMPLLGFKVWSKYGGWTTISHTKAIVSILIGIILFYFYQKGKSEKE